MCSNHYWGSSRKQPTFQRPIRNTTHILVVTRHQCGTVLSSGVFFRRHFSEKPVFASRNVGCFSQAILGEGEGSNRWLYSSNNNKKSSRWDRCTLKIYFSRHFPDREFPFPVTPIFLPSAIQRGLQDRAPVTRKLKPWRPRQQRRGVRQKSNKFGLATQRLCTCVTLFLLISLPSLHDQDVKLPYFAFSAGREQRQRLLKVFFILRYSPLEFISPTFVKLNDMR